MIFFWVILVILSATYAKFEIELEGEHGWAEKLPFKKLSKDNLISKIFFGGRPATFYHIYALLFVFVFAHIPYIFVKFSLDKEGLILAFVFLFWILEDFLWFVLNPHFGIRKFRKDSIWWHKDQWWGIAPREYFIFSVAAIILIHYCT